MHVCIVGAKSCPPEIGGIEVFAYELGRRLISRDIMVTAIVPRRRGEKESEIVDEIDVRRVWAIRNRYSLKVTSMPGIFRVGRQVRPDVFHANDPPSGVIGLLSTRWKANVLTVHGKGFSETEWRTPFRQGGRLLQRLAVKGADAVIASDAATASLFKDIRDDILVIPPGVDSSIFQKERLLRPESLGDDKLNVLFVGRLARVKGFDLLLASLKKLRPETLASIRLTVIGDGPMASQMHEPNHGNEAINWIGGVPHAEIPPYFAHADVLVMPSRSEGLPISMLEAMAAGLPVITTMVGGIGRDFDDRFVTPIESVSAVGIANSLQRAIDDMVVIKRKALAARDLVESKYSWDNVAERYLRIYERITA
jgi:glycosyltransferase involved in cell wall biosynthesis